jgi:hypothetical protein
MSKQRIIDLGSFAQGALPLGLTYQFLDGDGAAIDMSQGTWTGQAKAEQLHVDTQPVTPPGTGAVVVDDATAMVTYSFVSGDCLTIGRFQLVLWAGNGTNRVGSPTFEWEVYDAPGALPTV